MSRYVLLTKLNPAGFETIARRPERIAEVHRELAALDVEVVAQYALLGPYDFLTGGLAAPRIGGF